MAWVGDKGSRLSHTGSNPFANPNPMALVPECTFAQTILTQKALNVQLLNWAGPPTVTVRPPSKTGPWMPVVDTIERSRHAPFLPQEPNFSRSQYLHANCTTNVDDEMKFVGMTDHSQTMNFEARPHPLVPVNGIQRQLSAICSHLRVFSAERCIRAVT